MSAGALIKSPSSWILALLAAMFLLLEFPVSLPIGPYYWDLFLYPDAAWRIENGQVPNIDFFAPVGALEYYGYYFLQRAIPQGHQLLLAQWSLLLFSLPLFLFILQSMVPCRGAVRLALTIPFVFFSFVPLNIKDAIPLTGADGYGIYNRHSCLLLYLLVMTVFFVPNGLRKAIQVGLLLTALLFTKITAVAVGVVFVIHAALAGRLGWRNLVLSLGLMAGICALLEISLGIVSAYERDILTLIEINSGGVLLHMASRFFTYFDSFAPLMVLAGFLLLRESRACAHAVPPEGILPTSQANFFDWQGVWIAMFAIVGLAFEAENTGSLPFVFVWPYLVFVMIHWLPERGKMGLLCFALVATVTLPYAIMVLHRSVRLVAATVYYESLHEPALGRYGEVKAKEELIERAYAMKSHYADAKIHFDSLARHGYKASHHLYAEFDFELSWLIGVAETVAALQKWEHDNNRTLHRLIVLDFADIITPIMRREPVRLISIGMSASRTVAAPDKEKLAEAMTADALVVPTCPVTPTHLSLMRTYRAVLQDRVRIVITPCSDIYIKKDS